MIITGEKNPINVSNYGINARKYSPACRKPGTKKAVSRFMQDVVANGRWNNEREKLEN